MNLCLLNDWTASDGTIHPGVKSRLGIEASDLADDELLNTLIRWVSLRFEKETGRKLERAASTTEEFPGEETELRVRRYPVESVIAFALKSNETDGFVAQSGVDYLIRNACVVSLPAALGTWRDQLRVTFTGGFVLPGSDADSGQTALPDDIEEAAKTQVAHWYQRRHDLGLMSVSGGGGAITQYAKLDLLPMVEETLKAYRRF